MPSDPIWAQTGWNPRSPCAVGLIWHTQGIERYWNIQRKSGNLVRITALPGQAKPLKTISTERQKAWEKRQHVGAGGCPHSKGHLSPFSPHRSFPRSPLCLWSSPSPRALAVTQGQAASPRSFPSFPPTATTVVMFQIFLEIGTTNFWASRHHPPPHLPHPPQAPIPVCFGIWGVCTSQWVLDPALLWRHKHLSARKMGQAQKSRKCRCDHTFPAFPKRSWVHNCSSLKCSPGWSHSHHVL